MATLNFKHLRYFWMVARAGSITRASAQLHVTPQSISSQLAALESALGVALFRRVGRGLETTDIGRRIVSYAEEILGLEGEVHAVARDQESKTLLPFRVGISDSVPKSLTCCVVEPALHVEEAVRVLCKEGRLLSLLADLSVRWFDAQRVHPRIVGEFDDGAMLKAFGQGGAGLFVAPAAIADTSAGDATFGRSAALSSWGGLTKLR